MSLVTYSSSQINPFIDPFIKVHLNLRCGNNAAKVVFLNSPSLTLDCTFNDEIFSVSDKVRDSLRLEMAKKIVGIFNQPLENDPKITIGNVVLSYYDFDYPDQSVSYTVLATIGKITEITNSSIRNNTYLNSS